MQHTPVSSSTIASVGYDADSRTMRVEFNSGKTCEYNGVTPEAHRAPFLKVKDFLGAKSLNCEGWANFPIVAATVHAFDSIRNRGKSADFEPLTLASV